MSYFFDVSDSDHSLNEDVYLEEHAEKKVAQIDPKWFEVTDDEDADERQAVLSKNEKSLNDIMNICDHFDFHVGEESWLEAEKFFNQLRQKGEEHKKKFKIAPLPLLECLQNTSDLSEKLGEKATFKKPEEYHSLKRLIKAIQELTEWYADDLERLHDEEAEEESDDERQGGEEKQLTEEDIVQELQRLGFEKGKRASKCQKLAQLCKKRGYIALQITAMGIFVEAVLDEDNRLPYVSSATWMKSYDSLCACCDLVLDNSGITVKEELTSTLTGEFAYIIGGLSGLLQKLHTHYLRIAQFKNCSTDAYFDVIRLENSIVELADRIFGYYQRRKRGKMICCKVLIDILAQRRQKAHDILYNKMSKTYNVVTSSVFETVRELSRELFLIGDKDMKCCAILSLAYQMGLEGMYREGRDLLLRSGMEETIGKSVHLSILHNRVIAQLGLASFAAGDIVQCYNFLGSLWSDRSHDVLIGQRLPECVRNDDEEELKYRDLLVPPHCYIQHAQLELAAMLSTLVIDTTKEAKKPYEVSRYQSYFYRVINQMNYQTLLGEPVEFREQIRAAYSALKLGDYVKCSEFVKSMGAWSTMPNGDRSLKKFLQHLKEAAFRIFCYNNRCNFLTISVDMMMMKYDLSETEVKSIINDIISENNSSLIAFWDREDKYLHVDQGNHSWLQYLVEGVAESVLDVAQYSERRVRENDIRGGRGRWRGRGRGGRQ